MLPRHSTSLALLLIVFGMCWFGDACSDELMDSVPTAAEYLCCNTDSPDEPHAATASLEQRTVPDANAAARVSGVSAPDATARIRLRPQQHTIRGPPSIYA